jgi:hypothetical protein
MVAAPPHRPLAILCFKSLPDAIEIPVPVPVACLDSNLYPGSRCCGSETCPYGSGSDFSMSYGFVSGSGSLFQKAPVPEQTFS